VRGRLERLRHVEHRLELVLALLERDGRGDLDQLGVEAGDRAGARVHHHQRVDAGRVPDRDAARHHAAHRVAEQAETLEPDRVGDLEYVRFEAGEAVRVDGRGLVALAVAAMVERDDGVVAREQPDVVGEVLLGTAEPVHEQQGRPAALHEHFQRRTVVGPYTHVRPSRSGAMLTYAPPYAPYGDHAAGDGSPGPAEGAA
jgi:hypothetical protein